MITDSLVSIILPVYNRIAYLDQAVNSVLNQTYQNWELFIADDNSVEHVKKTLKQYEREPRVVIRSNPANLGLFGNINRAIEQVKGEYIIFLCEDDILLPSCINDLLLLQRQYAEAELILSSIEIIDVQGNKKNNPYEFYCDIFCPKTKLWSSQELVPMLLKYGSINGNLTRIWFKKQLFDVVGGFREDWSHAGDWEWLYRVSKRYPVLISRTVTAAIRSHDQQLSVENRTNLRGAIEDSEVIKTLLNDLLLTNSSSARIWAIYRMHYYLWLGIKLALRGHWDKFMIILTLVSETTGFWSTFLYLIKFLPARYRIYKTKQFALPPK